MEMSKRRKPGPPGKKAAAARSQGPASRGRATAPAGRPALSGRKTNPTTSAAATGTVRAGEKASFAGFPADCTIAQAGEGKASLAKLIARQASITLDLSQIRRIDTAALQVFT